ncbi:MAG: PAS domain S-box protein [Chitinivibrionales bacterium]|nr:PAS domain S-box protein [Chitinivibrionales bacterium]
MKNVSTAITQFILRLYTIDKLDEENIELRYKYLLLNVVLSIGLIYLAVFSTITLLQHKYLIYLADMVALVLIAASMAALRFKFSMQKICNATAVYVGLLFLYMVFSGGVNGTGPLWSYSFPLVALFFLNRQQGLTASLVYFCLVWGVFYYDHMVGRQLYTFDFRLRFSGSYLIVMVMAYFFQIVRYKTHQTLLDKNKVLKDTLNNLEAAEDALRESEAKYRLLVERASDAIIIIQNGQIEFANQRAAELSGFPTDELTGKAFIDFVSHHDRDKVALAYKNRFAGCQVAAMYEASVVNKQGSAIPVEISGGIITYKNAPADLVFIRNIQQRKNAEHDRAVLEEQLLHSQKMESIGRLAGGIAHDYNNILGAIAGYADMIRQQSKAKQPKFAKYADTILRASQRAADLTTKLLAFARKGKYEVCVFDMHDLISDTVKLLKHSIDKKVKLNFELQAERATIKGDGTQIQNVLLNLVINAQDAMCDGGSITFATDNSTIDKQFLIAHPHKLLPGEYLKLSVIDTGIGMEEGVCRMIFEPFFSTKELGKGTGLGLASVYGTIKSHHGAIEVSSEPGKGSCFEIYLPLTSQRPSSSSQTTEKLEKGIGKVLLIDDEEFIRDMGSELLTALGYSVETCADGNEAIEYFSRNYKEINLVLIDMIMPACNGSECFTELKKIDPSIRAIVLSGYTLNEDAREILRNGALGFVQKPFTMKKISKAISSALHAATLSNL